MFPVIEVEKEEVVTTVHESYCKHCPSKWYPDDPESADIKLLPDGERQLYVFPCAWRGNKLCKGVCENLGYEEYKHGSSLRRSRERP